MRIMARVFFVVSVFVLCLAVASCASSPLRWYLKPTSDWHAVVLDKTVPHEDYREHGALFWVLRHEKVSTPDGQTNWVANRDYVGFTPAPDDTRNHGQGRALTRLDVDGAELLFLADSYGVYRGDYENERPGLAGLDYSPKIYGGLDVDEIEVIEDFTDAGGHLIAEFNTFASPTYGEARRRLERLLGVEWSGWSGRYFSDLGDTSDVPTWARREWLEQNQEDWAFRGPGYIIVHEDTTLVVLRQPIDVAPNGLRIHVEREGLLTDGLVSDVPFAYWFDIVQPTGDTRVAASYRLGVTDEGRGTLERHGIPSRFPAILVGSEEPLRMYLAGDFSDAPGNLGPHWAEGLPWFNNQLIRWWFPRTEAQEPFYWGVYIPLLRNVLRHTQPGLGDDRLADY